MSEMMLLETAIQLKYPNATTSKKTIEISGNKLLKSYGEDSSSYTQSFNYYASNKEQMKEMYNEILEEYNISLSKIN
jgi:phage gp45-like